MSLRGSWDMAESESDEESASSSGLFTEEESARHVMLFGDHCDMLTKHDIWATVQNMDEHTVHDRLTSFYEEEDDTNPILLAIPHISPQTKRGYLEQTYKRCEQLKIERISHAWATEADQAQSQYTESQVSSLMAKLAETALPPIQATTWGGYTATARRAKTVELCNSRHRKAAVSISIHKNSRMPGSAEFYRAQLVKTCGLHNKPALACLQQLLVSLGYNPDAELCATEPKPPMLATMSEHPLWMASMFQWDQMHAQTFLQLGGLSTLLSELEEMQLPRSDLMGEMLQSVVWCRGCLLLVLRHLACKCPKAMDELLLLNEGIRPSDQHLRLIVTSYTEPTAAHSVVDLQLIRNANAAIFEVLGAVTERAGAAKMLLYLLYSVRGKCDSVSLANDQAGGILVRVLSGRLSGVMSCYHVLKLMLKLLDLKREDAEDEWNLWTQLLAVGLLDGLRCLLMALQIGWVQAELDGWSEPMKRSVWSQSSIKKHNELRPIGNADYAAHLERQIDCLIQQLLRAYVQAKIEFTVIQSGLERDRVLAAVARLGALTNDAKNDVVHQSELQVQSVDIAVNTLSVMKQAFEIQLHEKEQQRVQLQEALRGSQSETLEEKNRAEASMKQMELSFQARLRCSEEAIREEAAKKEQQIKQKYESLIEERSAEFEEHAALVRAKSLIHRWVQRWILRRRINSMIESKGLNKLKQVMNDKESTILEIRQQAKAHVVGVQLLLDEYLIPLEPFFVRLQGTEIDPHGWTFKDLLLLQEDVRSIIATRTDRQRQIEEACKGPLHSSQDYNAIECLMPVFNDLLSAAHDVSWVMRHVPRVQNTIHRVLEPRNAEEEGLTERLTELLAKGEKAAKASFGLLMNGTMQVLLTYQAMLQNLLKLMPGGDHNRHYGRYTKLLADYTNTLKEMDRQSTEHTKLSKLQLSFYKLTEDLFEVGATSRSEATSQRQIVCYLHCVRTPTASPKAPLSRNSTQELRDVLGASCMYETHDNLASAAAAVIDNDAPIVMAVLSDMVIIAHRLDAKLFENERVTAATDEEITMMFRKLVKRRAGLADVLNNVLDARKKRLLLLQDIENTWNQLRVRGKKRPRKYLVETTKRFHPDAIKAAHKTTDWRAILASLGVWTEQLVISKYIDVTQGRQGISAHMIDLHSFGKDDAFDPNSPNFGSKDQSMNRNLLLPETGSMKLMRTSTFEVADMMLDMHPVRAPSPNAGRLELKFA